MCCFVIIWKCLLGLITVWINLVLFIFFASISYKVFLVVNVSAISFDFFTIHSHFCQRGVIVSINLWLFLFVSSHIYVSNFCSWVAGFCSGLFEVPTHDLRSILALYFRCFRFPVHYLLQSSIDSFPASSNLFIFLSCFGLDGIPLYICFLELERCWDSLFYNASNS